MATVLVASPAFTSTVNGANTYVFGPGWTGPSSPVSRWVLEGTSAAFLGTVIVKARLAGNNGTFVAVPYYNLNTGGTVGTGPNTTATLVNSSFLIEVDASEMEVALDCTAFTSGTLTITGRLVQG